MTSRIKLNQHASRFRAMRKEAGEELDITSGELIAYWIDNGLTEKICARCGLNGLQRPNPDEPWSLSNITFDQTKAIQQPKKPQDRKTAITPKTKADPTYRVLRVKEWLAEVRQKQPAT